MKDILIGSRGIGRDHPPFVIAEAGINHNGDIGLARELVDAAAESGADAVKFQTHLPDMEMLDIDVTAGYIGESFHALLSRCQLSWEDHLELKERAVALGLIFLSTPFSREAADLLEKLGVPAFKSGSGELTNIPLLCHVARKGLPMIISTGMSGIDEIEETVNAVSRFNDQIILMHCNSTYPAKHEEMNIGAIPMMEQRFDCNIGISDHSPGIYTALGGVALGASVIEKHFTLDRSWPGPDQGASILPDEMKELVAGSLAVWSARGIAKVVLPGERPVQDMARESVVSLISIPAGTTIEESMVWVKRPGTGIPAKELPQIVGKKTRRSIDSDQLIAWEDLE